MQIRKRKEVIKRFLVLSDLHIVTEKDKKKKEKDNYDKFEANLLTFLEKEIGKLDHILLCGDLTDKNCNIGYERLGNTLKKIHKKDLISRYADIICCPGNHDLDRSCIKNTYDLIQDAQPKDKKGKISNWLINYLSKEPESYERIEKIHKEKFTFYNDFINKLYPQTKVQIERSKSGFTLNFDNQLLITSINSAWFCNYPDDRKKDDGSLILGMNFIKESMVVNGKCNRQISKIPRITIMHYPPEAFVWSENYGSDDKLNSMKYLTDNSSLVISGHVHGLPRTMGYNDGAYLLSSGTTFNNHLTMSFIMFELNIHSGEVELFQYQMNNKDFKIKLQTQHFQSFKVPLIKCEDAFKVAI